MPLAFRSILSTDNTADNLQNATSIIQSWLSAKRLPIPAKNGQVTQGGKTVSKFETENENWRSIRWQVDEEWDYPAWYQGEIVENRHGVTSISIILDSAKIWFWVEVDSPTIKFQLPYRDDPIEEPQFAATPKVLRDLIGKMELSDGQVPIFGTDAIYISQPSHLEKLFGAIQDQSRISTLMVTAPPFELEEKVWETRLKPLVDKTAGISNLVIIDSKIIGEFNSRVGRDLLVPRGSVRSFLPGTIFQDKDDSYRHKLLTAKSIDLKPIEKIANLLNRVHRTRIANLKLPRLFLEVDAALIKLSRFSLVLSNSELEKRLEEFGDTFDPKLNGLFQELVKEKQDIEYLAEQYAQENSELKSELNDLKVLEELVLEADAIAFDKEQNISLLLEEVSRLRQLLAAQGRAEEAYEPAVGNPLAQIPESFEDLINRLKEFRFLEFVGQRNPAIALDDHPGIQSAIPKAWNTLRTLNDYCRLKDQGDFVGGLLNYVENSAHGGFVQGPAIKPNESETVLSNRRLRELREIPVPPEVDPSGIVVTKMHVALQTSQSNYPRLYFFDASGTNGKVYIGYLGEHLENTRTN